jgi:hypothetical protein
MTISILGALPVGGINIAAAGSVGLATGLISQLDLALFGSFGLGGASADLSLQFSAALDAEVQIGVQISDPTQTLLALANLLAGLSIGLPTVNLQANAALSANIASAAAISAQLGGISALIEAALAVKVPAVNFFTQIAAAISAGPLFLINFSDTSIAGGLAEAGLEIGTLFSEGLVSGSDAIAPFDPVYGVVIVTKDPAAFAALGAVLKIV